MPEKFNFLEKIKIMKLRKIIAAIAIAAATPAFACEVPTHAGCADVAKSLSKVLKDLSKGSPAQFEGVKYDNLEGYIRRVEGKTENGQRYYLIEVADAYVSRDGGFVTDSTLSTRMLCVTADRAAAASLTPKKRVRFTAMTSEVQNISVAEYGNVRQYKTLIANCQFN